MPVVTNEITFTLGINNGIIVDFNTDYCKDYGLFHVSVISDMVRRNRRATRSLLVVMASLGISNGLENLESDLRSPPG